MFDKKLFELLENDKKYVYEIVAINILLILSNITITMCICMCISNLLNGKMKFTKIFMVAIIACIVRFLLDIILGHCRAKLGSNVKEKLRGMIYDRVLALGTRETDDLSLASLTQVAIEGVEQLDLYYSTYVPQLFTSMISPVILFVVLMQISRPSAIILLCCVPFIPMSIIAVSHYAKKIFAKYWGQYTKMGDAFLDNISGMKELKIFNADKRYHDKMNNEAEDFRKITMKVLTMQLASTTIMDFVAYGGAGLGIVIAIHNHEHIHMLFNMHPYALLLFIVLSAVDFFLPMRALGSAFHVSMNGATAGGKILSLLSKEVPQWGNETIEGTDFTINDVTFGYDRNRKVLEDISFKIKVHELCGIVGLSGSGKSTLIALLAGLVKPDKGSIYVGDKSLERLSRQNYYQHLGLVSYNSYLFNDTIRNNFKMANEMISDGEIYDALKKVCLDEFIRNNGGLDLILKEDSVNLSGGQKQRLATSIALVADKDMYFFDEVTSNIDAQSEKIIMDNIYTLASEKTIIVVSHRLKNFEKASHLIVLNGGHIIQEGPFEKLSKEEGLFKNIYNEQINLEEGYI